MSRGSNPLPERAPDLSVTWGQVCGWRLSQQHVTRPGDDPFWCHRWRHRLGHIHRRRDARRCPGRDRDGPPFAPLSSAAIAELVERADAFDGRLLPEPVTVHIADAQR